MVKANELRIGNLVYGPNKWKDMILPIDSIHSDETIRLKIRNKSVGCFSTFEIDPVLITKDILYAMGAEQFPDGESLILFDRLIGFAECRNKFIDKHTGIELNYAHQLQNLYFMLTGKELTIKQQS